MWKHFHKTTAAFQFSNAVAVSSCFQSKRRKSCKRKMHYKHWNQFLNLFHCNNILTKKQVYNWLHSSPSPRRHHHHNHHHNSLSWPYYSLVLCVRHLLSLNSHIIMLLLLLWWMFLLLLLLNRRIYTIAFLIIQRGGLHVTKEHGQRSLPDNPWPLPRRRSMRTTWL